MDINYRLIFPVVIYWNISEKYRIRAECIQLTKEKKSQFKNGINQIEKKSKQLARNKIWSKSAGTKLI